MAARKRRRSGRRTSGKSSRRARGSGFRFPWGKLLLVALALLAAWLVWLDATVRVQFEGKRWALPARVYARPLELYAGRALRPEDFLRELKLLGYRGRGSLQQPGDYARSGARFHVYTRSFAFWDGREPSARLGVQFSGRRIERVWRLDSGSEVALTRLEPQQIASIYPAHKEDRVLVRLEQVPPMLVDALIAVEDRDFRHHHGISPRAVMRALLANLRAGGVVQGGSTLTQQLVKNFFLSRDRTLLRKLNEAAMALLLELHYDKDEILEAYLNEVYLGQDGARAIHGFGLASEFYFDRPLQELAPEQVALLVALVKGPSYYDPQRHPQRARERRDLVLTLMQEQGVIDAATAAAARRRPLGVLRHGAGASNAHPAFLELVRAQLARDYREEDLRSEGLNIFTTLDPLLQYKAQAALASRLGALERERGLPPASLQGAVVVTGVDDGEVVALVGDRDARAAGFNRALNARRQVGSLIKPFVYLSALSAPRAYTLATWLDDEPLELKGARGEPWMPQNYDRQFRGRVLLHDALVQSLNVPTVRLGMALGVRRVIDLLQRMGLAADLPAYPSLYLGAVELTPLEVTGLYQVLATGGYRTPLRAIRAVLTRQGEALQRYPLEVAQAVPAAPAFLVDSMLQDVVREGTAVALAHRFGAAAGIAGKTGTTDDLRDSWFAGFDGAHLAVVWVGRDDNGPMGLTGAGGALRVWSDLAAAKGVETLALAEPEGIEWVDIDRASGLRADSGCSDSVQWPFIAGSAPAEWAPCASGGGSGSGGWFGGLFE